MNPLVAGVALAVTFGAVTAVAARDARAALVGLAIALVATPFLSDPLPGLPTLAARVVGAALAAYLVRSAYAGKAGTAGGAGADRSAASTRAEPTGGGSRLGWPAEVLLAAAAAIVGVSVASNLSLLGQVAPGATDGPLGFLTPSALATAAGLAAVVVAFVPAFSGHNVLRTTIGAMILLQGLLLVRTGVAGAPEDLEQLAGLALLIAIAGSGVILAGLRSDDTTDETESAGRRAATAPTGGGAGAGDGGGAGAA